MSNIMLKELYVDNFKSFHKSKFEFGKVTTHIDRTKNKSLDYFFIKLGL